jgi:EAL domain-containing protein (putative c-di-GMP-specific phosphodiesterase class I)
MSAGFRESRELIGDLRFALERNELELHYQPIVEATSGDVRSMEALLRWTHGTRGSISPSVFIPLAEQAGLIGAIGEWALQRACADAARWPRHVKVAVNFSALQISNPRGAGSVREALRVTGLEPDRLEIEVTESVILAGDKANLETLRAIRALGVSISLDDFGTGYSSLSYLTTFPFDKIKIDKSFVEGIASNEGCAAIIASTTALARTFKARTVAEGIETPEQYRLLQAAGVNEMQGFLFGRPLPARQWEFPGRRVRPLEPRTVEFLAA